MIIEARGPNDDGQQIFSEMIKSLETPIGSLNVRFIPDLTMSPSESNSEPYEDRYLRECVYNGCLPNSRKSWVFDIKRNRFILTYVNTQISGLPLVQEIDEYFDLSINNLIDRGSKVESQDYKAASTNGLIIFKKMLKDLIERDKYTIDSAHIAVPHSDGYPDDPKINFYIISGDYCISLALKSEDDPINQSLISWMVRGAERFNLEITTQSDD